MSAFLLVLWNSFIVTTDKLKKMSTMHSKSFRICTFSKVSHVLISMFVSVSCVLYINLSPVIYVFGVYAMQ